MEHAGGLAGEVSREENRAPEEECSGGEPARDEGGVHRTVRSGVWAVLVGKKEGAETPADESCRKEQAKGEGQDEASFEEEIVQPEQFEIEHGSEDEEGQFCGRWECDEAGCGNESVRRAAEREE